MLKLFSRTQHFGKFLFDVAVGVTVAGISEALWGDNPSPTVVTPTYTSYYNRSYGSSRTVQLNNTFVIAPPPPSFSKDSAVGFRRL